MDKESTLRAVAIVVGQLDAIATGSDLGADEFRAVAGTGETQRDGWVAMTNLAIGLLNVALVLAGRCANATGQTPQAVLGDIGLMIQDPNFDA